METLNYYICDRWVMLHGCTYPTDNQESTSRCTIVQYSIVQYSIVYYRIGQYGTGQYSIVQYSIVQYSIVQYSIVQYSIVQYSIVQMKLMFVKDEIVIDLSSCAFQIILVWEWESHYINLNYGTYDALIFALTYDESDDLNCHNQPFFSSFYLLSYFDNI